MKTCAKCKQSLPVDKFGRDKRYKDSLQSYCRACTSSVGSEWQKKNRQRATANGFKSYWKALGFDLTKDMVQAKLEEQNYACGICKDDLTEVTYHYDHEHDTTNLRDILCSNCNRGLGLFGDDPHLLDLAAAYLRKHKT